MSRSRSLFPALVAVLSALGLLVSIVSHGPRPQPLDLEATAYVLSGGSLSDLCLGSGDAPTQTSRDCLDCNLCKSIGLAAPFPVIAVLSHVLQTYLPVTDQFQRKANAPRGPPVRGPPSVLL